MRNAYVFILHNKLWLSKAAFVDRGEMNCYVSRKYKHRHFTWNTIARISTSQWSIAIKFWNFVMVQLKTNDYVRFAKKRCKCWLLGYSLWIRGIKLHGSHCMQCSKCWSICFYDMATIFPRLWYLLSFIAANANEIPHLHDSSRKVERGIALNCLSNHLNRQPCDKSWLN